MITIDGVDLSAVPGMIKRCIRSVGLSSTLQLLDKRAGIPLKVPVRPDGLLLEFMGHDQALAFIREFGAGTVLSLSMPDKLLALIRNRAMRADRAGGATLSQLALKYRLTKRQVVNILGAEPAETAQTDLFAASLPPARA